MAQIPTNGWAQKRTDEAPYAFLSSIHKEHQELRSRIFELGERLGRFVYVDEMVWKRDLSVEDPLGIADYLIRKIREAEVFICLLGARRHGDPIKVSDRNSSVSFLEIELFQAALLKKPIYLYVLEGFQPEPALASILEVLEFALPRWSIQQELTEAKVEESISRLLQATSRPRSCSFIPLRHSVIRKLVQSLYFARGDLGESAGGADVLFLDGRLHGQTGSPDKELIQRCLRTANEQRNEELRLARLWFAIRELMKLTPHDLDRESLAYWNSALGEWGGSATWYGLHGHLYMGSLAAFNSMAMVRERLRESTYKIADPSELRYPGGQLASAQYSIAKRLYDGKAKQRLLDKALRDANKDISEGEDLLGNTLSVRAAIYRAVGELGHAVRDYEEVLHRREQAVAGPGSMGVAFSNLGYAYVLQGRLWKGRSFLEEGVKLLSENFRTGFLARAKRKLAVAYLLTGRPVQAYEEMAEAQRIAQEHGAFDQM